MKPTNSIHSSVTGRVRLEWVVFTIALLVRGAAGVWTGRLMHPEIFEYDGMARSLVSGSGLVYQHLNVPYHSFAPPLYPWLSAASYWLFDSLAPLMVLQLAGGSGLAVITAQIARRLYPGWMAALTAGLLVAVHPGLIIYNVAKAH